MGAEASCSGTVLIRKRWPSADTPYGLRNPFSRVSLKQWLNGANFKT